MKNKIITVCIILAALLSFMSFAAVLTQMNAKGDEPEEKVSEEIVADSTDPDVFCMVFDGSASAPVVFHFEEGVTWSEFMSSSSDNGDFTLVDDRIQYCGYYVYSYNTSDVESGSLPESNFVYANDPIISTYYFFGNQQ